MSVRNSELKNQVGWALLGALSLSVVLPCTSTAVRADNEDRPAEVENSRMSATGIVNSNGVPVRCGPSDTYYPTTKLDKGARVTVVGMKFDWLKIAPPEGSFCYISKIYVEKHGDGSVGRVVRDDAKVRAGSTLTPLKVTALLSLNVGAEVQIIGEQEEYFKIKPTKDAYLFIKKQDVSVDPDSKPVLQRPDRSSAAGTNTGTGAGPATGSPGNTGGGFTSGTGASGSDNMGSGSGTTGGAAIESTPTTNTSSVAAIPSTRQSDERVAAETLLDKAESDFKDASTRPLDQQPLGDLIRSYTAVREAPGASDLVRRIAEARLSTLKVRQAAADDMVAERKAEEDLKHKELASAAEREELQARVAAAGTFYTAVGTLSPSSLQRGSQTLYRLTDPATGRTVVYIRTNDSKFAGLLDKFVGVKGEVLTDPQLKLRILTPTDVVPIDQGRIGNGISAQLLPPSMQPQGTPVQPANSVQQ